MKLIHFLFLVWGICAHLIEAQNATQSFPACTIQCMELHVPQSTCSITDQACLCTNTQLQEVLTKCIESTCSVKEGLATRNISAQACGWPYHDRQSLIRMVTIPFFTVATLFFATRIAARLHILGGEFGPDDYSIGAAWLLSAGLTAVLMLLANAGLGKDIWSVPFESPHDEVTETLRLFVAYEKLYIATIWTIKISILLLYLRIFPDPQFRLHVKICLGLFSATVFCLFMACLLKCWPISYSWTFWDGEHMGSCSSQNAQGWANASLNVFADLIVLVLPWPSIYKLSMPKEKKMGIMVMFSAGVFVTMVSMVRLYTLKAFTFSKNPTWDFVNLSIWSAIEIYVSITCACLPGARNFYNRVINGRILGKGPYANSRPNSPSSVTAKSTMALASEACDDDSIRRDNSSSSQKSTADSSVLYTKGPSLEKGSFKEFVLVVDGPREEKTEQMQYGVAVAVDLKSKDDYSSSRARYSHYPEDARWAEYEEWPVPKN